MAWQAAAVGAGISAIGSLLGAKITGDSNERAAKKNIAMQKQFAQQGIRWKVEDAKKAGIHPLAALGANTISYKPTHVGQNYGDLGMGRIGQDISRSINSQKTKEERDHAIQMRWLDEQKSRKELGIMGLEEARLQRDLLNSPSMPAAGSAGIIPGQTGVNQIPAEQVLSGSLGVEKSVRPFHKMVIDQKGRISFTVGKAMEEALENDFPSWIKYIGNSVHDNIRHTFRSWMDTIVANPSYRAEKRRFKSFISRELGLKSNDIYYSKYYGQWMVKPNAIKRLNR